MEVTHIAKIEEILLRHKGTTDAEKWAAFSIAEFIEANYIPKPVEDPKKPHSSKESDS